MKISFSIVAAITYLSCFGQTFPKADMPKIGRFKADVLHGEMYKRDTLNTPTAMFTRERLPNVRRITAFPKDPLRRSLVEYYYNDTKILENSITYDSTGRPIGISKQYDKKGRLEYIQDYDKGTWTVVSTTNFPCYQNLKNIKQKARSIIIANYGKKFFTDYVVWQTDGSSYHDGKYAGSTWNWYNEWEPKEFTLSYAIKFSEAEYYDDQIWLQFDSLGNLTEKHGLQKATVKDGFHIAKEAAIQKAKKLGLYESDSAKAFTFLKWESFADEKLRPISENFIYCVGINTNVIKHPSSHGRHKVEYKYEVYVFNPWTGDFIEKRKMKSFREWEQKSGLSTGLIPDN